MVPYGVDKVRFAPAESAAARDTTRRAFGLDPGRRVLFVFPGSLAARSINRAVAEMLPHWAHLT